MKSKLLILLILLPAVILGFNCRENCTRTFNIDVVNGENLYVGEEDFAVYEYVNLSPYDIDNDNPVTFLAGFAASPITRDSFELFEDIGFDFTDLDDLPYILQLLSGYDLSYDFDGGNSTKALRVFLYGLEHFKSGSNIDVFDLTEIQENRDQDTEAIIELVRDHEDRDKPYAFIGFTAQETAHLAPTFEIIDRFRYAQSGSVKIKQYKLTGFLFEDDKDVMDLDIKVSRGDNDWTIQGGKVCRGINYKKY